MPTKSKTTSVQQTYNLVHTYVEGNSFHNIFGGVTPSEFGYITHIEYLTPMMKQRWPWMKNKWSLSDGKCIHGYFNTLREAKAEAEKRWPGCYFKTPAQFRKEAIKEGR